MSVRVWLHRNEIEEKLEQLEENDNLFSKRKTESIIKELNKKDD